MDIFSTRILCRFFWIVTMEKFNSLTEKGRTIAERMYDRHQTISNIFMQLVVPEDIAKKDACRVEHYISNETYDAMKRHFNEHITLHK